jgi:outer membrane receptor protein involved in Fe transport
MRTVLTARSAGDGTFVLRGVAPGGYSIGARAAGYTGAGTRSIDVRAGSKNDVDITLNPSPDSLVTIGHVRVNGGETLSTSSAPSVDLDAQSYAERGYTRVSDMLNGVLGLSLIRPAGGNAAAPAVASLRGPDPTETLIDIDGHEMNMANSGAFDLSLLDPADFSNAQVVYGISPSSLVGANTIGGAINLRTLEPTADSRALLRVAAGSFGTFGETVQTTGTKDRIGYAFSLHRTTSQGDVNLDDVGSAIAATNALAKLRYTFARGGFATVTFRDSSIFKDESAALSAVDPASEFTSFAGSAVLAHNAGYGFDLQLPLGKPQADGIVQTTALFRHLTALTSQSVTGPASGSSPYFFNDRDLTGDDTLEIDRMLSNGMLSAKFGLRNEALDTQISLGAEPEARARRPMDDGAPEAALPFTTLAQKQRSFALRYAVDATPKLHYALAGYYSWFERYGTSFDPRAGIVWTPTPRSALRFSIGTTFQAPELTELYVPPELPPPDAGGHIDIGNPHLKPDRATEFDLGYEHIFGVSHRTHASIDLYRTNLRGSAQRYLPAATCTDDSTPAEQQHCLSYPINIGLAVYQGMELRFDRDLDAQTTIHAGYGLNSAYPASVPPQVQDGTLVAGQQFLGLPLHKATLSLERDAQAGLGYNIGFVYEGANNALNRPPFATLNAALTWRSSHFDVTLAGTNLSNVYADRFTRSAAGVAYPGAFGPIPTDAYALQGAAFTLSVTRRY